IELESARAAVVQHHVPMSLPKEKDRDRQTANWVRPAQRWRAADVVDLVLPIVLKSCSRRAGSAPPWWRATAELILRGANSSSRRWAVRDLRHRRHATVALVGPNWQFVGLGLFLLAAT